MEPHRDGSRAVALAALAVDQWRVRAYEVPSPASRPANVFQGSQGSRSSGFNGMVLTATLPLTCAVGQGDGLAKLPVDIGHHPPGKPGDLLRPHASLQGQQHHHPVTLRVPAVVLKVT